MKKNLVKKSLSLVAVMLIVLTSFVFASTDNAITAETLTPNSEVLNPTQTGVVNITQKILGLLQVLAVAIALVMLIVIGIKAILNAGGKDRTKIKDVAIDYVFGAACIFGATGILTFIQQIVAQFTKNV